MRSVRNSCSSGPPRKIDKLADETSPRTRIFTTPGRAPKRERIFRSGRDQPDPEALAQRIQLIRQRDHLTFERAWDRIFHAHGLVVVVDGGRDCFAFALRLCVQSADNALQLGELFHHVRRQIAFGEQRSPVETVHPL